VGAITGALAAFFDGESASEDGLSRDRCAHEGERLPKQRPEASWAAIVSPNGSKRTRGGGSGGGSGRQQ